MSGLYQSYNPNPHKSRVGDCAIRASTNTVYKPLPSLKLIKTSEDGNVAGFAFQIFTGRSAPAQDAVPLHTVTTGDDGTVLLKNFPIGISWVREVVSEGYVPQKDRQIRIISSDNPATVRFDNSLLRGSISANKVDFGGEPLSKEFLS